MMSAASATKRMAPTAPLTQPAKVSRARSAKSGSKNQMSTCSRGMIVLLPPVRTARALIVSKGSILYHHTTLAHRTVRWSGGLAASA